MFTIVEPMGGSVYTPGAILTGGGAPNPLASVPWVAQWKFNNNGNDSVGANNLTAVNSPTFTDGKIGGATGATQCVAASSQYWSIADNAALSMGDLDFTVCVWVYFATLGTTRTIASQWDGTGNQRSWFLFCSVDNKIALSVSRDGSASADVIATTFGATETGVWYCVIAGHDSVNNQIFVSVNNSALDTIAHTTGVKDSNAAVTIGAVLASGTGIATMSGRIDNVCIAKSAAGSGGVLSAAQRTAFYNAGNGTETLT